MEKKFSSDELPLAQLLDRAARGELQLPDFQRGWVWDDDHIRSLLASISLSYPIGAIMTLVAGNPDVNFKARLLEGVTLAAPPAPELLLLDGQQRLTSLFQALKSRAPVCTRDRRGNELQRHYYASVDACIDPSVDRREEEMYGGAAETRFAGDLEDCIAWIEDIEDDAGGVPPRTVQAAQFQAERLLTLRTRNSAAYKGLYALQMKQGARDFKTGRTIDIYAYIEDAIDIHHVFPRHWCASHGVEWWIADCIVNKTALDAHTNRRVGGNAPSLYLSRIDSGDRIEPHVLDGFLRSHDIDPVALRRDDFAQFFNQRFESLIRHAERAMGKPVNRRPGRDESPFAEQDVDIEQGVRSLLDGGESAVVEFKSTGLPLAHRRAMNTGGNEARRVEAPCRSASDLTGGSLAASCTAYPSLLPSQFKARRNKAGSETAWVRRPVRGSGQPESEGRREVSCRRRRPQDGGGSASRSGTMGVGARSIVIKSGRSSLRWRAVRTTLASTCCVSAPLRDGVTPPQRHRNVPRWSCCEASPGRGGIQWSTLPSSASIWRNGVFSCTAPARTGRLRSARS